MIEQLRSQFPQIFAAGNLPFGLKIAAIMAVACILAYLFFAKKNHKNPLWGLFVLIAGVATFLGFIVGGIKIGNMFGFEKMGAFIGIFAFFGLAMIYKFFATPKDQRRKRFM